jgi:coenzyme F420 hydrogenase subunit beta
MKWNDYGFLVPELTGNCDLNSDCLSICPFNPFPEKDLETENELAELFLKSSDYHHPKIGKYKGIYVFYSNEFRLTSSSGGLATYIFTELIEKGIVDHIFSVKESAITGTH